MLQRPDNQWKEAGRRDSSVKTTTILMVNGLIVLVLVILALASPRASEWISAAAEAEFVGADTSGIIAQPAEQTRLVRSN